MERILTRCLEMWHTCANSFTTTNLQLGLLIGSGVLAIALLVLALTRWGQSRPVWKCVILSFVAHILLLGYAYGTHLMFEAPEVVNKPDPLRVNLVEEVGESFAGQEIVDATPAPWDQFVNQAPLPEADQLERPMMDSQVVLKRTERPTVEKPSLEDGTDLPVEIQQDVAEPSEAQFESTDLSAVSIDQPQIESAEIDVTRKEIVDSDLPEPLEFESPFDEMDRPEFETEFQPLERSQVGAERTEEDAQSFVGELLDRNAELPLVEAVSSPLATTPAAEFRDVSQSPSNTRMRLVSRPRRLGDGQPMPKIYSLRNASNRLSIARKRGGSIETERAVNSALRWLAENQQNDGRWDASTSGGGKENQVFGHDRKGAGADADCGITALAALSFLAAGHTHLEGPYQDEIRQALEFLVRQQKRDGNLSGDARLYARMYCHSMSLLSLSEALAITGDQRLYQPVQRGVDYSIRSQHRQDGGWRYQPGDTGDMSQFGWQVLALHSARIGGAVVPQSTFDRMELFLDRCCSGVGNGLASYRPGQGPSTTMTAEALLCRYFLKTSVSEQTVMEASRRMSSERPTLQHVNLYYWYYGTMALYHAGGSDWDRWNAELKKTLLALQNTEGADAGSWPANGLWAGYGGKVYSTAMAALNLEVYYRYLPLYDVAAESPPTGGPVFR